MRIIPAILLLLLVTAGSSKADETFTFPTITNRPVNKVRFMAVGDILLGRGVNNRINKYGRSWVCAKVEHVLRNADIAFGNLESPLTTRNAASHKGYVFKGQPQMADQLAGIGFDALSVANNHIFDHGRGGLKDTLKKLEDTGI